MDSTLGMGDAKPASRPKKQSVIKAPSAAPELISDRIPQPEALDPASALQPQAKLDFITLCQIIQASTDYQMEEFIEVIPWWQIPEGTLKAWLAGEDRNLIHLAVLVVNRLGNRALSLRMLRALEENVFTTWSILRSAGETLPGSGLLSAAELAGWISSKSATLRYFGFRLACGDATVPPSLILGALTEEHPQVRAAARECFASRHDVPLPRIYWLLLHRGNRERIAWAMANLQGRADLSVHLAKRLVRHTADGLDLAGLYEPANLLIGCRRITWHCFVEWANSPHQRCRLAIWRWAAYNSGEYWPPQGFAERKTSFSGLVERRLADSSPDVQEAIAEFLGTGQVCFSSERLDNWLDGGDAVLRRLAVRLAVEYDDISDSRLRCLAELDWSAKVRSEALRALDRRGLPSRDFDPQDVVYAVCLDGVVAVAEIPPNASVRGSSGLELGGYYEEGDFQGEDPVELSGYGRANRACIKAVIGQTFGQPIGISAYDHSVVYAAGDYVEVPDFDFTHDMSGAGFYFYTSLDAARKLASL